MKRLTAVVQDAGIIMKNDKWKIANAMWKRQLCLCLWQFMQIHMFVFVQMLVEKPILRSM